MAAYPRTCVLPSFRPLALLALLFVGAASAAPVAPLFVPPRVLVDEYASNEVRGDLQYKDKLLELVGVVEAIGKDPLGRIYVSLASGVRHVAVTAFFPGAEAIKVAALKKGALVAVHGLGGGLVLGSPVLSNASVVWVAPDAGSAAATSLAVQAAKSGDLCVGAVLRRLFAEGRAEALAAGKSVPPDAEAKFEKLLAEKLATPEVARFQAAAKQTLAARGLSPMNCDHPLIRALAPCEEAGEGRPECRVRLVTTAISLLAR